MNFKEYLTPAERAACWQRGIVRKFAEAGVNPATMRKEALFDVGAFIRSLGQGLSGFTSTLGNVSVGALGTALVAGLPVGVVLHLADKSLRSDGRKTKELKARRDTYRDAMAKLRLSLGQDGASGMEGLA